MKPSYFCRAGFTLLEVLIALAILAVSSLAVMSQTGTSISQLQRLEEKTTALLIAEYEMNKILIANSWPNRGRMDNIATYAGREWLISTEVQSTSDPWLRKIDISVNLRTAGIESSPVFSLTTYKGRY